jgi:hypothetical protein
MKKKRLEHGNLSLWVSGCCILFILVFFTNGYSQDIHRAVSEGDLEKVELLLKKNPLLASEPSILNGYITGNEMKDMPWIYFDLGFHPPKAFYALQGRTPIYSMQDRVKHLSFVLNDVFDRYYSGLDLVHPYFPKPGQSIDVEGMKVTVVQSYRNKKGYFIQCDDLSVFWLSGLSDDYITSKKDTEAIEFVKENFSDIDLLFLGTPEGIGPEKGNGIRESFVESMRLDPKAVFFMGKEPLERRILYQIKRRIQGPGNIYCAENPGDLFFFSKGEIK